eukprot:1243577-Pleurochrysis_carterae.AAC.1
MCAYVRFVASGGGWVGGPDAKPLPQRGALAPRCPSTLPYAPTCRASKATGDGGWDEHLG